MSYAKIQTLLDTRLAATTGLPTLQLENTRNIAKTGVPFTRGTLLPARSTQISLGTVGKDLFEGLYQVDIFIPQDGGTATVNALVDAVLTQFARGTRLVNGAVTVEIMNSWREVGSRIENFYSVPVTVEWRYFK